MLASLLPFIFQFLFPFMRLLCCLFSAIGLCFVVVCMNGILVTIKVAEEVASGLGGELKRGSVYEGGLRVVAAYCALFLTTLIRTFTGVYTFEYR